MGSIGLALWDLQREQQTLNKVLGPGYVILSLRAQVHS